jgi:hypothetical protein
MVQFCTQEKASVMGVDVTFNLGKFYVTFCSYQNLYLSNVCGNHPVMIGPALLHSSKSKDVFANLFNVMVKKAPSLTTKLRAYGTDGEVALYEAAADAFPFAVHLRCTNHLRDNVVNSSGKQFLVSDGVIKEITSDIFGSSTEKGLLHSSIADFNAKLAILENKWKLVSGNPAIFPWFTKKIAPIVRDNMRSELLLKLGLSHEKYTQNNSESLNALVKRYVSFKKQDLLQFVIDLEECVLEQKNEAHKAIVGMGRWKLLSEHNHFKRDSAEWFTTMSNQSKVDALESLGNSSQSNFSSVQPSSPSCSYSRLSMPYSCLAGLLSEGELLSMWNKAESLLNDRKVLKAPGINNKTRWIASDSASAPHVVTVLPANKNRYVCDQSCVGWKTRNICSHTIAAASDNNELPQFITWYRSTKGKSNLTTATYHGTYKHAGQKKPPRRKYGNAVHFSAST